MTGTQTMHLGLWKILQIRFAPFAGKKDVVLTPENNRPGLALHQKRLPFRIQIDILPIVVKEIELNAARMGRCMKPACDFHLSGVVS